jgi:hypothetical protein
MGRISNSCRGSKYDQSTLWNCHDKPLTAYNLIYTKKNVVIMINTDKQKFFGSLVSFKNVKWYWEQMFDENLKFRI